MTSKMPDHDESKPRTVVPTAVWGWLVVTALLTFVIYESTQGPDAKLGGKKQNSPERSEGQTTGDFQQTLQSTRSIQSRTVGRKGILATSIASKKLLADQVVERLESQVEESENAAKVADEMLAQLRVSSPPQSRNLGLLVTQWSEQDPVAAWNWIATRAASGELRDGSRFPQNEAENSQGALWQNLVGSFIEGVAVNDPERAIEAEEALAEAIAEENEDSAPELVSSNDSSEDLLASDLPISVDRFKGDLGNPGDSDFIVWDRRGGNEAAEPEGDRVDYNAIDGPIDLSEE